MTSIRRRFINWLHGVSDGISEKFVEVLRRHDVHSEAHRDGSYSVIPSIPDGGGKSYVDNAVVLPQLGYQIDEMNRHAVVTDINAIRAERKLATGLNDHLVFAHSKILHIANPAQSLNSPAIQEQNLQSARSFALNRESSDGGAA